MDEAGSAQGQQEGQPVTRVSQHTALGSGQSCGPGLTCCSPAHDLIAYFYSSSALGGSSAASLNIFKLWVWVNTHPINTKGFNLCPSHVNAMFVKLYSISLGSSQKACY